MMYSVMLVLALAAQGYARPNCFFACDYPVGQAPMAPMPGYPSGNIVQPSYPSGNIVQPNYPSGNMMQQPPSMVDTFRPVYQPARPRPSHSENFPSNTGSYVNFNHESQASQKTSISGSYHFPAPSPPMNEPMYQPYQKPCRVYSDCS